MDGFQLSQGYSATTWRQFTFYCKSRGVLFLFEVMEWLGLGPLRILGSASTYLKGWAIFSSIVNRSL